MFENYITVFENLPYKVKGFIMYNSSDDIYTIVLNSRSGHEKNKETFEHELQHIQNKDFSKYREVGILEAVRH